MKKISRLFYQGEVLFLSFFGIGFFPMAPGTMASLLTVPLLSILDDHISPLSFFCWALIMALLTSFMVDHVQKREKAKDPDWIVIDEVMGMSVAWTFLRNDDFFSIMAIFVLFRFFDIIKFWPANEVDKKVRHGLGVMADDLISALYAGGVYTVLHKVFFSP